MCVATKLFTKVCRNCLFGFMWASIFGTRVLPHRLLSGSSIYAKSWLCFYKSMT